MTLVSGLNIGKEIGRGHFGVVHEATDDVQGRVAVKVLSIKTGESQADWTTRKAAHLREAKHLASAAHQNIVQVFYNVQSEDDSSICYCMEFCEGGSAQTSYEAGPMDVAAVKRLVNDVCLGLASLHAKGMLHRDIKPANILLDYRGKAKIGDFGLVTDDLLFGYADQAGYSDHLAFEVWHKGVTSAQSDIWALGMTMYRLLHGSAWYDASPLPRLEIHKGNFAGKLPWLPHISADWRRVIRKMMRDDTDYRYKTVAEVQKAIAPLMVQRPWSCTVSKNTISWELREAGRRKLVLLDRTNPKSCTWKAVSHPLSNGQSRRLAASKRPVAFNAALGELQRYFQGR